MQLAVHWKSTSLGSPSTPLHTPRIRKSLYFRFNRSHMKFQTSILQGCGKLSLTDLTLNEKGLDAFGLPVRMLCNISSDMLLTMS